jgi:hypothetical protein
MITIAGKRLTLAYIVLAVLLALMMCASASFKLTYHPAAVQAIHAVVGVPLNLFPVLAALEIAGGLGLIVGIFRPKIGVAAGIGLVCYFAGALIAHARVADWVGITAPIMPFLHSLATLSLRVVSMRREAAA